MAHEIQDTAAESCMEKFISIKKIKNIFAGAFDRDSGKMSENPYRDWALVVFTFLVVVFFLVSAGFYLFIAIKSGEVFVFSAQVEVRTSIDKAALDAVIENNTKKKELVKDLLENPPTFVDPSR